jgi:3-oxoadipate enol-lactonase
MPIVNADGCPIYVEVEGPERAPVLMLSNSLGTTLRMWDLQVAPLTQHFRLVRYDRRGHGRSGVPKGPYTMERLGRDVLAVLDALAIRRINWCGLSMGGMVGQWLGANAPERVERLVLTNTSSYYADKTAWNDRLKLVREKGVAAFAAPNMERWFTAQFRERAPEKVAWLREMFAATPLDGYLACGEAVRDMDHRDLLPKIKAPTLVVAGKYDPATPPEANEYIKNHIPGAVYGSRGGPYFQCRAGGRLYQGGAGILARQIGASLISVYPRAARNSCGVVPVCLRKKRAKWDGSEKARS